MRRAQMSDLETVRSITADAYAAFQAQIGTVPWPIREDYRPRIENGEVWILDDDSEPAGIVVLENHDDHMVLFSVAVRSSRHGQGHGTALLAFADRQAVRAGYSEIRLYTNALMERQIRLYERCGYVVAGRRPHPFLEGHVLVDMAKSLAKFEGA